MAIDYAAVAAHGGISKGPTVKPVSEYSIAKQHRAVYAHVGERDGLRCRACGTYGGVDIHRHHLRGRKFTTHEDVCCVCDDCHDRLHVRVGGKTLKLYGDADVRNSAGMLCGLTIEIRQANGIWIKEHGR
jgi:hypothetical protein